MKRIFLLAILSVFFITSLNAQEAKKKSLGGSTVTPAKTETKAPAEGKKEIPKITTTTPAKETKATASKKGAKPIKGKVISFTKLVAGGDGAVTKDEAQKLAEQGNPIVFKVGDGKKAVIYFVYNTDGSYGGKNLAKYANNKNVGIIGKTKVVNGIKIIIAETIESMD